MAAKDLQNFTEFLQSIDLGKYRKEYLPIKIVEMDLPKNIQSIAFLYKIYWDEKRFVDFDEFYTEYLTAYKTDLEIFRRKIQMCEVCFYKGLPARTYRTWASLVTQIHAGYVAESVFGPESVSMSEELDHKGADFQVKYKDVTINYQVKKNTHSREVRKEKISSTPISGEFKNIAYDVPASKYFENPRLKNGELSKPYRDFMADTTLQRLPNGFVVFTTEIFLQDKSRLDK